MFSGLLQRANRPALALHRRIAPSFATISVGAKTQFATTTTHTQAPKSIFELSEQLERQDEIIENIKRSKENLLEKQSVGRDLAVKVGYPGASLAEHLQADKSQIQPEVGLLEKQQRYHMFIEKMHQLYKKEKRLAKKRKESYERMELSPVHSTTPIKQCLSEYSRLSRDGFDCSVLAQSLKRLNQAVAASGNNPLVFNDYSLSEMDQSWRIDKLTEDIKFGLNPNPNVFFSPYNLAEVARQLGDLGYKNTELTPLWFDKIESMLAQQPVENYIEGAEVKFGQAMFGGQLNFLPRHYVYQGFAGSDEFKQHVETLLMYQHDKRQAKPRKSSAYNQIKNAAQKLIEASKEVKNMQKEMQAAVRTVRMQYQKLKAAHDEYTFLQENRYVHYDLLELQEMLIKAGYLHPDEQMVNEDVQVGALGMDQAVEVFYDLVLNYHPEVLSPQYDSFYDAATDAKMSSKEIGAAKGDRHGNLNIHTLSSTLIGLEKQVMSYRRDLKDKDYPTEFYEKLLNADEQWFNRHSEHMMKSMENLGSKIKTEYVKMERTYLNGWRAFEEKTQRVPEVMLKMIQGKNTLHPQDCYSSLRALNTCKFEAKELRELIGQKYKAKRCEDNQSLVDGIYGLAGCSLKVPNSDKMVEQITMELLLPAPRKSIGSSLAPKERVIDTLTFLQAIELLQGLTTPSMVSKDTNYLHCVKALCTRISQMNFENIANELKFYEYETLYTGYMNMKHSEAKKLRQVFKNSFQSEALTRAFDNRDFSEFQFEEARCGQYDPIKPRVVGGLSQSLARADLRDLKVLQENQTNGMYKALFPFAPDILLGVDGQKVGVFVLNDDQVMRDSLEADGFSAGRMQLVEQAHRGQSKEGCSQLKGVALPVKRVVTANLEQAQLSLRDDFTVEAFMRETGLARRISNPVSISTLQHFSSALAEAGRANWDGTSGAFEEFMEQLLFLLRTKERMDSVYEQEQVLAAIDELKLQMLKLVVMHQANLSQFERELVQASLPTQFSSFDQMITKGVVNDLNEKKANLQKQNRTRKTPPTQFWEGNRQEVEVPPLQSSNQLMGEKSILPELLNQKFLWFEHYHHYDDWKTKMSSAYDQFNLLELSQEKKDEAKLFFKDQDMHRRIPRGIFPDAKAPRVILQAAWQGEDQKRIGSTLDEMTTFERSPLKTMVGQELERNNVLREAGVTQEMTVMCNLQNVKHGLKSDATDHQICDLLFNKFSFTDKLIEEHLGGSRSGSASFVERDPQSYRRFIEAQSSGETVVSPFDQFYMREAVRRGNPEEIYAQIQAVHDQTIPMPDTEMRAKLDELNKQLEDCLMNYKNANEDKFNLSKALDNKLEVTIDINSFGSVQKRNDVGLSASDLDMAAEIFLQQERCRAEANLIKARITYKVHSQIKLSKMEKQYLSAWMEKATQTDALLPRADILVPEKPSMMSLAEALSPEDFYALNSLPRVSIEKDQREAIALNDLVLELGNFVDPETVRKVELGLLEENLKKEWELAEDFRLVGSRNKEIDLVMKQMEELTWRVSSMLDQRDKQYIEDMVFVDRGLDGFDNAFLEMDKESFSAFFDEANDFDNRVNLLENWMCRKDEEVRKRVNLPTPELAKSDQALFAKFDAPLKKARESLVGKMLTTDEFGKERMKKNYDQLTSQELHLLVDGLCVRLNLFQQKYPAFLPQVVKAVMEHKNLANSDKMHMDAFCKLFELDWRGDQTLQNREEFLMSNPVYLDEKQFANLKNQEQITNERVIARVKEACQPFLPQLIRKMKALK